MLSLHLIRDDVICNSNIAFVVKVPYTIFWPPVEFSLNEQRGIFSSMTKKINESNKWTLLSVYWIPIDLCVFFRNHRRVYGLYYLNFVKLYPYIPFWSDIDLCFGIFIMNVYHFSQQKKILKSTISFGCYWSGKYNKTPMWTELSYLWVLTVCFTLRQTGMNLFAKYQFIY